MPFGRGQFVEVAVVEGKQQPTRMGPPSLPAPPAPRRSAFLQALDALSPSSLFRARQQHAQAPPPPVSRAPKPDMPAHVMDAVLQLVDFLEEHHRREEGLYRKRAPSGREASEIRRVLRGEDDDRLPDLGKFSPHSLTTAIKEAFEEEYAPLIPYRVSQSLLERTAGQDEAVALSTIISAVKGLKPATCELLKVFLIHLNHISTSIPCRMSSKALATHIGVLLVRPTAAVDDTVPSSVFKQRRRLARLLIENANALPYNDRKQSNDSGGSEVDSPTGAIQAFPVISHGERGDRSVQPQRLHYVQVIWDSEVSPYTEVTLKGLLLPFGNIATLAINESGNRAIVAFITDNGAQAAAEATLAGVRIRRRKQRTLGLTTPSVTSQCSDSDFITPKPSPTKDLEPTQSDLTNLIVPDVMLDVSCATGHDECQDDQVTQFQKVEQNEKTHVIEESRADSPRFLHKLERPPSILLEQRAMQTMLNDNVITLEDVESPPPSPKRTTEDETDNARRRSLSRINEVTEEEDRVVNDTTEDPTTITTHQVAVESDNPRELQRRRSLKQLLTVVTRASRHSDGTVNQTESEGEKQKQRKPLFSPPAHAKIGMIADLKLMISRKRMQRSVDELRSAVAADPFQEQPTPLQEDREQQQSIIVRSRAQTRSIKTQTKTTIHPVQHQATDTDDLPEANASDTLRCECEVGESLVEKFATCLSDVKSELTNLAAALDASHRSDIDQAILQAHATLNSRISLVLDPNSVKLDANDQQTARTEDSNQAQSATSEFICFLEARAATQVKILEAEIRAGQELLRLHRSQYQKEIAELESEVTRLHVMQHETEKMCSELRSELRKCRAELTYHVATAASIQRDRRDADEKLIICENKLRAKEQELLQLRLAHDEMQDVAGNAQRRLEEHRGNQCRSQIPPKDSQVCRVSQSSGGAQFPRAVAFLKEHSGVTAKTPPVLRSNPTLSSVARHGPIVNTEELSSMRKRLEESIHIQVESTEKSLRELQAFGNNHQLCEDDMDLEELEQQLGFAQHDLDSAMNASRQKLQHLLDPVRGVQGDFEDDFTPQFDPTELVESLHAKALLTDFSETNQDSVSQPYADRLQPQPVELLMPSWRSQSSGIQSEMYKKWMRGRLRETANVTPGNAPHTSPSTHKPRLQANGAAVRQAQESMLRFQQTLASMKKPAQ